LWSTLASLDENGKTARKDVAMAKKAIARVTLLACLGFKKPLQICVEDSHCQRGVGASQDGKPILFCSHEMNLAQMCCSTTKTEPLGVAETLKTCCSILIGHEIKTVAGHSDQANKHQQHVDQSETNESNFTFCLE